MKPVILCVDDEPVVLKSLEIELSSTFGKEYFLEFAESGEEALEVLEHIKEEGSELVVIVADYLMPRMKGDRLLTAVHQASPDTVKILLTGQASLQGVTNAINHANLYSYIAKPWERADLALTLKEAIKLYYKERKLIEQNTELKELNSTLEQKVADRTKALQEQKEQLANTLEQLKKTQSDLISSERMASLWQLTAGIAHELNNPLNFVYSGVEAFQAGFEELAKLLNIYAKIDENPKAGITSIIEEVKDYKKNIDYKVSITELSELINNIKEGTRRSADIVKGLKLFTGLDRHSSSFMDINRSIDITLRMLESMHEGKIIIHKQYGSLAMVKCYANQINQVLLHVLTNAIQAIEKEGKIYISTSQFKEKNKSFTQISVKDTGKGISPAHTNKIFEPFFTTREVGEGRGLGLSISYGIIEMHNGKIEAHSQEGAGTEILITIPTELEREP